MDIWVILSLHQWLCRGFSIVGGENRPSVALWNKVLEQAFTCVFASGSEKPSQAFHRPAQVEDQVVQNIGGGLGGELNALLNAIVEGNNDQVEVVAVIP